MPHPYLHRSAMQREPRRNANGGHAAGTDRHSPPPARPDKHAPARRQDDVGSAPESGEKPEVLVPDRPMRR